MVLNKMNYRSALVSLCLFAPLETAVAVDSHAPYSTLVTLDVRHYDAAVNYGHDTSDLATSEVGVSILDRYRSNVFGGVEIGIARSDPTPRPSLAGVNLHGHYLGLELTGVGATRRSVQLFASMKYRYTDLEDETNNQVARLRWHRLDGIGGIIVRPTNTVQTRLYASRILLDGKYIASGRIDESIEFAERENFSVSASIQWEIEPGGYVGAAIYTGSLQGGALFFSRSY